MWSGWKSAEGNWTTQSLKLIFVCDYLTKLTKESDDLRQMSNEIERFSKIISSAGVL